MAKTFAMLKPEIVAGALVKDLIGDILGAGFKIVCQKTIFLSPQFVELFYREHQGKDFYEGLCGYICSGPVVCLILEKENAVSDFRALMGGSTLKDNGLNTLRFKYATDSRANAIHGSDGESSAQFEIDLFLKFIEPEFDLNVKREMRF